VFGPAVSDIGVKMFDAVNATMASITGVDPNNAQVKTAYANVRQSLPATHDIEAYLSSHQTSVAQLALQYCSVMVNDNALRTAFFPGLNINSTLADPSADRTIVLDNLFDKAIGSNLNNQPASARTQLNTLITTLCASPACGSNGRTAQVVTAACGAALGSAATMVQ
jgi:hypothetical protein